MRWADANYHERIRGLLDPTDDGTLARAYVGIGFGRITTGAMILTELGLGVNSSPVVLNSERGGQVGPLGAIRLYYGWQFSKFLILSCIFCLATCILAWRH
jgi:hypothetical protein